MMTASASNHRSTRPVRRPPHALRFLARVGLLAFLLMGLGLAGRGVNSTNGAPGWQVAGIGPAGGSIAAGDVALTLVPGALAQDLAVSILPQLDPFVLQPPASDPCTYSYLGPLWCCGPVGHDLLAASTLRVYYDETLIPAPFTEADLVLLEWDNTLQVLTPNLNATQNTALNYFENTAYMQLGHVAIGIRDCTQATGQIILAGNANVAAAPTDGVYLTDIDGTQSVFVSGALPNTFVPSPDGTRILVQEPDPQTEGTLLGTIPLGGGATIPIAASGDNVSSGDPRVGWILNPPTDRVWFTQFRASQAQALELPALLDPNADQDVLVRRNGDASDAITGIHGINTSTYFIRDIRQSPTGQHFLIVYQDFATSGVGRFIDVIETETGIVVSSGLIPPSGGQHTPRFTPDGSGVYLVDALQTSVVRYDLDGSNEATIFSFGPGQALNLLQDAVLAPDGQTLAVIVRGGNSDVLYLATADVPMMGIVHDTYDLGTQSFYDEVVWNPAASVLYIDPGRTGVRAFGMDPTAMQGLAIVDHGVLPASDMRHLDIERTTGNLLHLSPSFGSIGVQAPDAVAGTAAVQGPGICVTDPTGANIQIGAPIGLDIYAARWLRTFRTTPGMFSDLVR